MTDISKSRSLVRYGLYRGLLICNSTYPADPAGLPELNGPRRDGFVLWRALTDPEIGMFLDENIEIVSERTSAEVLGRVAGFFDDVGHDDIGLLYFSGHAKRLAKDELVLCTRDTLSHSTSKLLSSGVPSTSLSKMIERSPARAIIVILDCCFSGSFKGTEMSESFNDLKGTGRYILAASNSMEPASDSDYGQPSPFTRSIVRGLMSAANSQDDPIGNSVNLDILYTFVESDLSKSGPRPWRGYDGSGTVVISRSNQVRRGEQVEANNPPADVEGQLPSQVDRSSLGSSQVGSIRTWLPTRRVAGDFSISDLRIWPVMALLGLAAASLLVLAYTRWPTVLHYTSHSGHYRTWRTRSSHSYLALILATLALLITACSIIEGVLLFRRSRHGRSRREILQSAQTRPMQIVRHVRDGFSYVATSAIAATLFGFENYSISWIVALSLIAMTAAIGIVSSLRHGDALYLGGVTIYIVGAFLPSDILVRNATLGINGTPGIIQALVGLAMITLWWLKVPRGFVLLVSTVGLLPILSDFTRSSDVEGPYVALVGLGMTALALALGAGHGIEHLLDVETT